MKQAPPRPPRVFPMSGIFQRSQLLADSADWKKTRRNRQAIDFSERFRSLEKHAAANERNLSEKSIACRFRCARRAGERGDAASCRGRAVQEAGPDRDRIHRGGV